MFEMREKIKFGKVELKKKKKQKKKKRKKVSKKCQNLFLLLVNNSK
jgi:hypothetical protein